MNHQKQIAQQRQRRTCACASAFAARTTRPRLCVFRSHKHTYAQVIDDATGRTLGVRQHDRSRRCKGQVKYGGNKTAAEAIGKAIAERALAAGIKEVCFDRGSDKYHGRVAALAEAAREAGLSF